MDRGDQQRPCDECVADTTVAHITDPLVNGGTFAIHNDNVVEDQQARTDLHEAFEQMDIRPSGKVVNGMSSCPPPNSAPEEVSRGQAVPETDDSELARLTATKDIAAIAATLSNRKSTPQAIIVAVRQCRMLLSHTNNRPTTEVINAGILPSLMCFISDDANPALQCEVLWVLTNVASDQTEHVRAVIEAGAIPWLLHLVGSTAAQVQEHAVWTLGNITSDSIKHCECVLAHGAISPLSKLMNPSTPTATRELVAWVLANFCRLQVTSLISEGVTALGRGYDDEFAEVSFQSARGLAHLAAHCPEEVAARGLVPRLIARILGSTSDGGFGRTVAASLQVLNRLLEGPDSLVKIVVEADLFSALNHCLQPRRPNPIVCGVYAILTTLFSKTVAVIQTACDAALIPHLVAELEAETSVGDTETKTAALGALVVFSTNALPDHVSLGVEHGLIPALSMGLELNLDRKLVSTLLQAVESILQAWETGFHPFSFNTYALIMSECHVCERLTQLAQKHSEDTRIVATARRIVSKIEGEVNDERQSLSPIREFSDKTEDISIIKEKMSEPLYLWRFGIATETSVASEQRNLATGPEQQSVDSEQWANPASATRVCPQQITRTPGFITESDGYDAR